MTVHQAVKLPEMLEVVLPPGTKGLVDSGAQMTQAGTDELVPRKRDTCLAKAGGARVKTA